jgi:hypothetical protein
MAVQEKFPVLVAGQWVSIAERIDTRKSLIVSMIGGACVLGITQAAPTVASAAGNIPAGIFLQGGDVSGPGIFRTSLTIDDELVVQEWYAWLVPGTQPSQVVFLGFAEQQAVPFVPATLIVDQPAGLRIVVAFSGNTAPTAPTCVSDLAGAQVAVRTLTLADGSGDSTILSLFVFLSPGGSETITVTGGATDNTGCYGYAAPSTGTDAGAAAVGSTVSVTVGTPNLSAAGELCVAAVVAVVASPNTASPFAYSGAWAENDVGPALFATPDTNIWSVSVATMTALTSSPQTLTVTFAVPVIASAALAEGFLSASFPGTQATISVFEAWEEVIPDPPLQTFPVDLPRLDPAAMELLRELAATVKAKTERGW